MAAIYSWFPEAQQLLTTTLYPIDTTETMSISISLTSGTMEPIAFEELEYSFDVVAGSYTQIRWFYTDGPYTDEVEYTFDVVAGSYTQIRWFHTDAYDDEIEYTFDVVAGEYNQVRVYADTPDEELQLSISIDADGTMELI